MKVSARSSYRQRLGTILTRRLKQGCWLPFLFQEVLDGKLTRTQALVLATIANLSKTRADADGWLLLTSAYLRDGPLKLSHSQQAKVLSRLKAKGLLSVRGSGSERQVKLKLDRLEALFN